MHQMSRDEWIAFANDGSRTGKVGVLRASGAPHVTPVLFVVDGESGADDYVVFNTGKDSVKGKALRRDPRFSLCVDEERPPYSFVLIEAEAELSDDVEAMLPWSVRLASRYMGEARGREFGERNAVPGEYLVRGRITKVVAHAGVAD